MTNDRSRLSLNFASLALRSRVYLGICKSTPAAAANANLLQVAPQAALRAAIRARMNFRLRRISASNDA